MTKRPNLSTTKWTVKATGSVAAMLGNIPHSRFVRIIEEHDVAGAGYTHAMICIMIVSQ